MVDKAKVSDLDDNLELAVGVDPQTGQYGKASKEFFDDNKAKFFQTFKEALDKKVNDLDLNNLFEGIATSLTAVAEKTVVSSIGSVIPNITKELQDISDTFAMGSDKNYDDALDRLEKIVDKTGINLYDYSQKLGASFDKLKQAYEKRKEAVAELETEREILKEKNIYSKIVDGQFTKEKELRVLTNKELQIERNNLKSDEKNLQKQEKIYLKQRESFLRQDKLTDTQNKYIIERDKQLRIEKENIEKRKTSLLPAEGQRSGGGVGGFLRGESGPEILRPVMGTFTQTLMAPVDAFKTLADQTKMVGRSFLGFGKSLGSITKLFGVLRIGMLPMIAVFLGITLAILGVIKLFSKLGSIWPFSMFGKKEEKDKEQGTGKYQSLDEGTYDTIDDQMKEPEKVQPLQKDKFTSNEAYTESPFTDEAERDIILPDARAVKTPAQKRADMRARGEVPRGDLGPYSDAPGKGVTVVTNVAPTNIANSSSSSTVSNTKPQNPDRTFNILNGGLAV
jgi:hypothetical protein